MTKTKKKYIDCIPVFDLQEKSADQINRLWPNTAAIDTWITSNHDKTISVVNAWGQSIQFISIVQSIHNENKASDILRYKSADSEARTVFDVEYFSDFGIVFAYAGDEELIEVSRFAYDDPDLFNNVGLAVNHTLLCFYTRHLFSKIRTAVPRGSASVVYTVNAYDIVGKSAAKLEKLLIDLKSIIELVGVRPLPEPSSDFDDYK